MAETTGRPVGRAAAAGLGWGFGTGALLLAAGAMTGGVRPILKGAIRGGIAVAERFQIAVAESRETAEDLYHEVLEERAAERRARDDVVHAASSDVVVFPEGRG